LGVESPSAINVGRDERQGKEERNGIRRRHKLKSKEVEKRKEKSFSGRASHTTIVPPPPMLRATLVLRCPQGKLGGRGLYWKKPSRNVMRRSNFLERQRQLASVEYFLRKHNSNDHHKRLPKRKLYEDYTEKELPWFDIAKHREQKKQAPAIDEGFLLPTVRASRRELLPRYSRRLYEEGKGEVEQLPQQRREEETIAVVGVGAEGKQSLKEEKKGKAK